MSLSHKGNLPHAGHNSAGSHSKAQVACRMAGTQDAYTCKHDCGLGCISVLKGHPAASARALLHVSMYSNDCEQPAAPHTPDKMITT